MENLSRLFSLLNSVLEEAGREEAKAQDGDSRRDEGDIKNIVIPEMNRLKLHTERGEIWFPYGRKQRMLESTYLLTDSLNELDHTSLGRKILMLQDWINAF